MKSKNYGMKKEILNETKNVQRVPCTNLNQIYTYCNMEYFD